MTVCRYCQSEIIWVPAWRSWTDGTHASCNQGRLRRMHAPEESLRVIRELAEVVHAL
jgi:hypothetical protein